MSPDSFPIWLRALDALAARAHQAARAAAAIRDETAIAWTPPVGRAHLTSGLFDRASTYAPGGATYALGLMEWERELLAPPFPQSGRLLIGGAGGGREAIALAAGGYQVIAFDPAERLVRAGAPSLAAAGGTFVCASYADLVRAAAGIPSPLAAHLTPSFDAVLLGWGSVSHVVADEERAALFRALRTVAPRAPVALSYDEPAEPEAGDSRANRLRHWLRRAYRRAGAPGYTGERVRYVPWAGILRESTSEELELLAHSAGYTVAKHGSAPGRMLLMPTA